MNNKHDGNCKITKATYKMADEFISGNIHMPIVECDCNNYMKR